jgi:SAM-dependent methyltransferase
MASKAPSTEPPRVHARRRETAVYDCVDELLDGESAPAPCRTILLGCGRGYTAVSLAKRGYRVLGIDPDRDLLAAARERAVLGGVEIDLMGGDPLALPPMPEEAFGLAVDFHTACDLDDGVPREDYLRQIFKLLMRNGVLLASAPPPRRTAPDRKKSKKTRGGSRTFAFAGPFVSDFTRAGFEVVFEGIRNDPEGEPRLVVHAKKPG